MAYYVYEEMKAGILIYKEFDTFQEAKSYLFECCDILTEGDNPRFVAFEKAGEDEYEVCFVETPDKKLLSLKIKKKLEPSDY